MSKYKHLDSAERKKGSIELARLICFDVAGPTDEDDDCGAGYGSIDIAEILSSEVVRLRALLCQSLAQNAAEICE